LRTDLSHHTSHFTVADRILSVSISWQRGVRGSSADEASGGVQKTQGAGREGSQAGGIKEEKSGGCKRESTAEIDLCSLSYALVSFAVIISKHPAKGSSGWFLKKSVLTSQQKLPNWDHPMANPKLVTEMNLEPGCHRTRLAGGKTGGRATWPWTASSMSILLTARIWPVTKSRLFLALM